MRDPIFQYLRTLGCQHALAEDIAQEALLRLHRALRAGLEINDVRGWAFRVAQNLWIDSRRELLRVSTMGRDDEDGPDRTPIDCGPDPEQQALDRERVRLIEDEVSRLPKLQRECLRLKSQGLPYHEIAVTLNISMTAAVYCVRRAVKRLRRRLNG